MITYYTMYRFAILLTLTLTLIGCASAPGHPCFSPYPFLDCGFAR